MGRHLRCPIFNAFIYNALRLTTAMNTVLVNAMIPVFIAIIAWLFFDDRLSLRQMIGVMISIAGLVFIVIRGDFSYFKTLNFSRGDFWTLGAGISWAVYSAMLRLKPVVMDPVAFLTVIIFLSLIFLMPFDLWELYVKGGFIIDRVSIASIAYVCVFPSVLAYIFWNRAVHMVGANRAGIFFHLMPVFSIVLAYIFLGEKLHMFHLAGISLIFIGIALMTFQGII